MINFKSMDIIVAHNESNWDHESRKAIAKRARISMKDIRAAWEARRTSTMTSDEGGKGEGRRAGGQESCKTESHDGCLPKNYIRWSRRGKNNKKYDEILEETAKRGRDGASVPAKSPSSFSGWKTSWIACCDEERRRPRCKVLKWIVQIFKILI